MICHIAVKSAQIWDPLRRKKREGKEKRCGKDSLTPHHQTQRHRWWINRVTAQPKTILPPKEVSRLAGKGCGTRKPCGTTKKGTKKAKGTKKK
jgi:hypothetical protein